MFTLRPDPRSTAFVCSLVVLFLPCASQAADAPPAGQPGAVDFSRDVRPILAGHCLKCHGQDDEARKAKLRLDLREMAVRPAGSGETPIVPGHPEKSELVRRIFTDDEDDRMPPPAAKNPLTQTDKEILKRWIADGAPYQTHWAWVKPVQAPLPKVQDASWPQNPIDSFVLARLEKEGLKPSPRADRYTLVRRLYLDLIGLLPTPEQAEAFVNDRSPGAYDKLVDELLASPHYGERWARRWLDLARYADTNGYEKDRPRSIWPWRDWVIRALNADMPFDQFTIKQLAGDMVPHATEDDVVATGFNRNSMLNEEGGIDPLEFRFYAMVDRVHVTSTTWLGLTMQCAQCHTHKFDPILHQDYYRFMAFLNNCDEPAVPVPDPKITAARQAIEKKIDAAQAALVDEFPVESKVAWFTPAELTFSAEHGSEAERLEDGSLRVTGSDPVSDTYTLEFEPGPRRVTHLQIEAIPDESLEHGGPGRGDQGGFSLSELQLEVRSPHSDAAPHPIRFAEARTDQPDGKYPIARAIDGKTGTAWSVAGTSGKHSPRSARFTLAEPLTLAPGAKVRIRLVQDAGKHQTLGRFRVSLGEEKPDARSLAERRRENRDRRFARWLQVESTKVVPWTVLRPVEATSKSPSLDVQSDGSIFASGDFTKSDTYILRFGDLPDGVTALRIEAMPDERLPGGGPGRVYYEGEPGDFFLSNLKALSDGDALVLTNASESFAHDQDTAAKAIDSDLQSGWSIHDQVGRTQNAVYQFAKPLASTNHLELQLTFERYYASALGRLRIWVTTAPGARASALPNPVHDLVLKYRQAGKLEDLLSSAGASSGSAGASPSQTEDVQRDRETLLRYYVTVAPELAEQHKAIAQLRSSLPKFPTTLVMQERSAKHPRLTHVHHRGDFLQTEAAVTPGVPAFLPPLPPDAPRNRLGLAEWLVSPDNPLTARVQVNRAWEEFFGRGLVRTTEDFGFQGDLPSHPALLDWLAVEFMRQGWSQKQLHRLIVTSATYQQSSRVTPELLERDPQNILLARGPRFRVDAEIVRDAALEASGLLSEKMGGPSVFPPQPPGVSTEGAYGALAWNVSPGGDRYRRGLYTFAKRTAPFAMSVTFDGPSGEACLARRDRSNTPLQALTLLNDTVSMECARALGRLAAQDDGSDAERASLLFRRCLVRPPSEPERDRLTAFYEVQRARFQHGEMKAAEMTGRKDGSPNEDEQAAWTALARVLLNLDEMVTKE